MFVKLLGYFVKRVGFFIFLYAFFYPPFFTKEMHPGTGQYQAFPLPLVILSDWTSEYLSKHTTLIDDLAAPHRSITAAVRSVRSSELMAVGLSVSFVASIFGLLMPNRRPAATLLLVGLGLVWWFQHLEYQQQQIQATLHLAYFLMVVGGIVAFIEAFDGDDQMNDQVIEALQQKLKVE